MRIATRYAAAGALIAVVMLAVATCLLQGTAISIATAEEGTGPQFLLSKPDGEGPFPAVVLTHGCGGPRGTRNIGRYDADYFNTSSY